MKNLLLSLHLVAVFSSASAQGTIKITSGGYIKSVSNAFIVLKNMNLVNNGTYVQVVGNGTTKLTGNTNTTTSGTGTTILDKLEVAVNNGSTHTLASLVSIKDMVTMTTGQLVSDSFLTLKSDSAGTARIATVASTITPAISGKVIVERYIPGRRKYRIMTSSVTTNASAPLVAGQENLSIWGNWQNQGNNSTPNIGTIITGGLAADGFDQQTQNASMYTYDDVNRRFVAYKSANGNNTKYTPLTAGIAYYMFVYGDRTNTISTSSPHNTVLKEAGTLLLGDQTYTNSSSIPLTNVTERYTFMGNPFASPFNWATVSKTNVDDTYWGWDPNLSSTGGFITVNTSGTVTLISPFTGTTGLNQYIQPGQGFFVRTTAASPVMVIREQDKVSNYNANAFRAQTVNDIPLLAINLKYTNGANSIYADGVLAAFDTSFSHGVGHEDAVKMPNNGENVAILNETNSLSIDARKMPQQNDTLFLNIARLTKPQYTLQVFAKNMGSPNIQAFLEDAYLTTSQLLSLNDTNNIVFNVNNSIPASFDINRFRIVFYSIIVILPIKFISIQASRVNEIVKVAWEVGEDAATRRYEVERSTDGTHFTKLAELAARGTANNETYQWPDQTPVTGNNFYRVRVVQVSGNSVLSKTVVVNIPVEDQVITVAPNPVINKQIHLHSAILEKGSYDVVLTDPQGREVMHVVLIHPGGLLNQVITTGKILTAGIYYLQLVTGKEKHTQIIFIQ